MHKLFQTLSFGGETGMVGRGGGGGGGVVIINTMKC